MRIAWVTRTCLNCGESFESRPSWTKKFCSIKCSNQGKFHAQWQGDKIGYDGVHAWIRSKYGSANKCENDPSHTGRNYHWHNVDKKYTRDISTWKQLCVSCHAIADKRKPVCRNGHIYCKRNTYQAPGQTARTCKDCAQIRQWERFGRMPNIKISEEVKEELIRQRDMLQPSWSLNEALAYILAGRAKAIQLQAMEELRKELDGNN